MKNPSHLVVRSLLEKIYNEGVLEGLKLSQLDGIPDIEMNKFGNEKHFTFSDMMKEIK
jgi:hypothetical protein